MKNHLIAVALASSGSFEAQAQSSATVFGVIDLAARQVNPESGSAQRSLASGGMRGSRLGLRAVEDLGDGLSAGFWLEADIAADTGAANATNFWSRRSTVSVSDKRFGELRLGRDYVPIFWRQYIPFDPWGVNGIASFGNMFFPLSSRLGSGSNGFVRTNNAVKYVLPNELGGVFGEFMVSAGEGDATNKHRGGVLGYAAGPVRVTGGFGDTLNVAGTEALKVRTVAAAYDFSAVTVSGMYQHNAYQAKRQKTLALGVIGRIGVGQLKFSYVHADQSGANTDANDSSMLALGYVHHLSKRTALYGTYARIDNRGTQNFGLGGVTPAAGKDISGVEVGLSHAF